MRLGAGVVICLRAEVNNGSDFVTEELLTEAHEETETPLLTLAFFVGFLLFLLLGMVA